MKNYKLIFSTYKVVVSVITLCLILQKTHAQIDATTGYTATELAEIIAGNGIEVSSATLACHNQGKGKFVCIDCNVGIDSGVVLTSGKATFVEGANDTGSEGFITSYSGDADLDALPGISSTQDACVLEFDLVPISDTITFDYVFGSEEYLEFVGTSYNDVFAFFISGPGISGTQNIALIPGTTIPVSINKVNNTINAVYYNNNGTGSTSPYDSDDYYIQYDGFTDVFQAMSVVTACETYHLKLAVADVGDGSYDSGVFIKANSLNSNLSFLVDSLLISSGDTIYVTAGSPTDLTAIGPGGYTYTWSPPGGLSTTTGSSTTATVTTTTTYTVTASDCATFSATVTLVPETVLPLALASFQATCLDHSVQIEWSTLAEVNTKEFIIERSTTGGAFQAIASIPAHENSNEPVHYTWVDNSVYPSTYYYRIKLVDMHNTTSYISQTITTACSANSVFSLESAIFSNHQLLVDIQSPSEQACYLNIHDVLGRTYFQYALHLQQGYNHVTITPGNLSAEQLYFVVIANESGEILDSVQSAMVK